jgi:hypothetical protein
MKMVLTHRITGIKGMKARVVILEAFPIVKKSLIYCLT